jgi:hypothetical protein
MSAPPPLPRFPLQIGPAKLSELGLLIRVEAPRELVSVIEKRGGIYDKGIRCWWVERRRAAGLIRDLEAVVDPLFRCAGLELT